MRPGRGEQTREAEREFLMRALCVVACAALLAIAGSACSKGTDTSAAGDATASAAAATASAAATATAAAGSTGAGDDAKTGLPVYPGAKVMHLGEASGQSGTVLTTPDSFDQVYDWYKSKMPAGSEKAKLAAAGISTVSFQENVNGGIGTVVINSRGSGPTSIALAHVSQMKL
jgi:hypothetical protein